MKFYVLRDTVQGIGDTFLSFKVRNETWTDYDGLDTTELEVYDTDGVETDISPLSFTWDQVQGRYQIGSDFTNLLTFLQEQNVFKLPLTVQEQQQQNEIEQGIYKIKFYFEDLYGNVTEIGERYIDISSSYYLQDYIPEESVTKITTDVETTTLDIGDTVEVTITPRYVDTQSYQQEIQIVVTPGDISTEQGVVKSLVSSTPLHEILVHGIEDLNDVKYEFDVETDTWSVTAVDQGDHETEIGAMSDTDPEYIVGQVQSQAIGADDSEIVISSVVRQDQSNSYTVEVVEGTGDDQQLQLDLTGTQLTITLGTDPETPQSASIGSGDDGTVTIETIDTGIQMNDYTVEVVEGAGDDQQLAVQLLAGQITVTLGTDPETTQSADIGSGDDGTVTIETIGTGLQMNDYTIEVVEGTGNDQQLQAALLGNQITVTLGTDPETTQSADIGSGDDGTVTIETIGTGLQMNDYTIEVVQGVGSDQQLAAQLLDGQVTVTLGTDGTGQLDPVKNTQTLVQQEIQQIDDGGQVFTQTASGTGNDSLTQAEGPTSFTGGDEDIQSPTKNTQTLVQQEIQQIDDGGQVFTQTASGTGDTPILQQEGPTSFTGGDEDIQSPTKNTQTLIQQEIQQIDDGGQVFTQVASGTGDTPILQQEGPTQFTGGDEDIQSPTKNTQDLIQQEIEQIEVEEEQIFTQIQQGTDPIIQQEGPTSFTGGLDPQFEIDETQEQIIYGQLDSGFTLYSTGDYSDFVLAKLSQDGKTILETINPLTELSDTILATFQESGYAQAYNELLPLLQEQELDHIISGGIYFEIAERGLSDVITYDTTAYAEDLRAQIQYIAKRNPGIFVITEDDPPSYPTLPYDNTTSDLDQTTIQQAIDELKQMIDELC